MEIVVIVGSIALTILVFTWMIKVVKATLKTAFLVAAILLALQLIFGIGPGTIWETIQNWLPQLGGAEGV